MNGYLWNGPQHRGAMLLRRQQKRVEAEARNGAAQAVTRYGCGHKHSQIQHQICVMRGAA